MTTIEPTPPPAEDAAPQTSLNAQHRCDQCGTRAYVEATLPGGQTLLYCAHHARRNEPKLRPKTVAWHDETHQLTAGA